MTYGQLKLIFASVSISLCVLGECQKTQKRTEQEATISTPQAENPAVTR